MAHVEGRYILYGILADENDDGNSRLESDHQIVGGTVALYGTDDSNEAINIMRSGGFIRGEDEWNAVTWAEDAKTGRKIGSVPDEAK